MIRFLFILCCSLLFQGDEEVLSWSDTNKLTWTNFKEKPNYNMDAVALTASGITFKYSISRTKNNVVGYKAEVDAHFYPNKSWYKPESADAYILSHEQLHFDITELHARKFRKRIEELKVSNYIKRDLEAIHKTINKELSEMQNSYDNQSDYSRVPDGQAKWQAFVTNELKKLTAFKSKPYQRDKAR